MTLSGWGIFLLLAAFLWCVLAFFIGNTDERPRVFLTVIGVILTIAILIGMLWWYGNTASGARAMKSQRSNFNRGMHRKIEVYDAVGNLIHEYEGRFDLDYDNDRIIFDDENGKRHIVFYPTGTVIVEETESEQ